MEETERAYIKEISEERHRTAAVYEVAGQPGVWRIRVEIWPEPYGWLGGKVLWGHDQPTEALAIVIAKRWTMLGELP